MKVAYNILPQAEYWPKLQVDLSSGAGMIDVFMTGPELDWPLRPGRLDRAPRQVSQQPEADGPGLV